MRRDDPPPATPAAAPAPATGGNATSDKPPDEGAVKDKNDTKIEIL